jgi:beta-N-acetylhexosaminidase
MRNTALWLGAILALPLVYVLRDPLLLQWRGVVTPLLFVTIALALLTLAWQWCKQATRTARPWLLGGLWVVVLLLAGWQEGAFHWRKHQLLNNTDASTQALGAHLIIGYSNPTQVKELVAKGLVGGIYIGTANMQGKTTDAIQAEIAQLQALRTSAGLAPLIVSTDQEGGIVQRMSPPLASLPPLANIIAGARLEDIYDLSLAYGQQHGRELAAVGVNVNFAPLADLSEPAKRQRFDFRSLINQRAIDNDPQRVSVAVIGYAQGLQAQGVLGTLKHFPGLGRVKADTHLFKAKLNTSINDLATTDWVPFRAGLRSTQSLLMVGHATLTAADATRPASLSEKVVQGIVREQWEHQGVIVTDDMSMGPVVQHGMCAVGVDAINAGVDLLLVSYDTDQYFEVMHCLVKARKEGRLLTQRLRDSDKRLAGLLGAVRPLPPSPSPLAALHTPHLAR